MAGRACKSVGNERRQAAAFGRCFQVQQPRALALMRWRSRRRGWRAERDGGIDCTVTACSSERRRRLFSGRELPAVAQQLALGTIPAMGTDTASSAAAPPAGEGEKLSRLCLGSGASAGRRWVKTDREKRSGGCAPSRSVARILRIPHCPATSASHAPLTPAARGFTWEEALAKPSAAAEALKASSARRDKMVRVEKEAPRVSTVARFCGARVIWQRSGDSAHHSKSSHDDAALLLHWRRPHEVTDRPKYRRHESGEVRAKSSVRFGPQILKAPHESSQLLAAGMFRLGIHLRAAMPLSREDPGRNRGLPACYPGPTHPPTHLPLAFPLFSRGPSKLRQRRRGALSAAEGCDPLRLSFMVP